jgi:uncharacterized protein YbjT (DUF2867 family)
MKCLITGSTGHIGLPLIQQLHEEGHDVRAFIRDSSRAELLPQGIDIAIGDLDDADTVTAAVRGVDGVFLLHVGAGTTQTQTMIDAMHSEGVSRIVLLSSVGTRIFPIAGLIPQSLLAREDLLRASGLDATYLRPTALMTNSLSWADSIRQRNEVIDATDPGVQIPIDPEDIARVAVRVLIEDGHVGHGYTLNGPEALTVREEVSILSDVLGHSINFVALTPEQAAKDAVERGTPAPFAEAVRDLNEMFRTRLFGQLSDDVENLTGIAPANFRYWCERHASAFQ